MTREQSNNNQPAVLTSPESHCPAEVLIAQTTIEVNYHGFDGDNHRGIIEVNKAVAEDVKDFFELAYDLRFPIEKILPASTDDYKGDDDKLMAGNVSSGFNYRTIADTNRVSFHGRGLAFDINPRQNPYIRYQDGHAIISPEGAVWNPEMPGTLSKNHKLVRFMAERGWEWGGNWTKASSRIDYQHFQKPME